LPGKRRQSLIHRLGRFDRNSYSVNVSAVGNPVTVRAYADRLTFVQDGRTVGSHLRHFCWGEVFYDP
jgi:hypothetical protein